MGFACNISPESGETGNEPKAAAEGAGFISRLNLFEITCASELSEYRFNSGKTKNLQGRFRAR